MAVRRMATPAAPVEELANFGESAFYSGTFGIPEGNYELTFNTLMHQSTRKDGTPVGEAFLGVQIIAQPINAEGQATGEAIDEVVSMGQRAKLSFVPSSNGKGVVAVPGGPASGVSDQANWGFFRKSLLDSGMPEGVFVNSLEAIDGIHVHIQRIPEPESRKQLRQGATGEAAMAGSQQEQRIRTMPVVTEFLDNPWTDAPATQAAPVARVVGRVAPKPVATPPARTFSKAPVAAPAPTEVSDEELLAAAQDVFADVLSEGKNAHGCKRLILRTSSLPIAEKKYGEEVAQAIINSFFEAGDKDANLNMALAGIGYVCKGNEVVVK